jgi:hypothetical protein
MVVGKANYRDICQIFYSNCLILFLTMRMRSLSIPLGAVSTAVASALF